MGPFRICMFLRIVFAAASTIVSIKAYTYVYLIAEEVVGKMGEGALDASLISDYGKPERFL